MTRIHRTRRRRNERWYSAWDEASLGYIGATELGNLSASWRYPGTRGWMRTWKPIHRYPFGVRRMNWTIITIALILPVFILFIVMQNIPIAIFHGFTLIAMMLMLLMTSRGTPALAVIRKRRTLLPDMSTQHLEQQQTLSTALHRRVRCWCSRELPARSRWQNNPIVTASSPRYAVLTQLPFFFLVGQFLLPHTQLTKGLPGTTIVFVVVLLMPAAFAVQFRYFPMLLRRAQRRYNERQCPDCKYDLSKSTPAIAPELLDGQFIGPRRCPECGTHWPLVPPPVPSV